MNDINERNSKFRQENGKASNGTNKSVNDEKKIEKRKEKSPEANWIKRLDKVSG